MDLQSFQGIVALIGGAGAIGTGLLGVYKGWKVIHKLCIAPVKNEYSRVTNIHKQIEEIIPVIKSIQAEFKPNGGSSLRDAVNSLDRNLALHSAKIEMLTGQTGLATFECDKHGQMINVNREFCNLANMFREDCKGNGWLQSIKSEDRQRVEEEWLNCIKDGRQFDMKFRIGDSKTDKYTLINAHSEIIKDRKGELAGIFGYARKVD